MLLIIGILSGGMIISRPGEPLVIRHYLPSKVVPNKKVQCCGRSKLKLGNLSFQVLLNSDETIINIIRNC